MKLSLRLSLALLLVPLLMACGPDPQRYGILYAEVLDCPQPQRAWAEEGIRGMNGLQGPEWRLASPGSTTAIGVRCEAFHEDDRALGKYTLGAREIRFDPSRTHDLFTTMAVVRHELVHAAIYRGPHPERARVHVCRNSGDSPTCWQGGQARLALMSPALTGDFVDQEGIVYVAQAEPVLADIEMFRWALSSSP